MLIFASQLGTSPHRPSGYLGAINVIKMETTFLNEINNGITLEYFAELVERMRHHQRRYFATGNQEILIQSKILEQRVDLAIEKLKNRG